MNLDEPPGMNQSTLPVDQECFIALYEVADHGDERFGAVGLHCIPRIVH